ncbi:hypothetical protein [Leclercia pneumoniae]|uniref:hypothetical protein n=1 Tax=Leclercia pneumoniae TaxID=2815358 RepID=UPI001BADCCE9|nr:hypothetical protein [Enterobacter sp. JGM127]
MKALGILLLVVGIVVLAVSLSMDTSIEIGYGQRINNLGLMRDQQNYLIVGAVIFLAGALMAVMGRKNDTHDSIQCPFCAEKINSQAVKCKHCGSDLKHRHSAPNDLWIPALYYSLDEGVPELNRGAVADLVCGLLASPDHLQGEDLMKKYESRVKALADGMPPQVRNDFLNYFKEITQNN